jgi:hypothetical protein
VQENVGVHQHQQLGVACRLVVDEAVPGIDLAALRQFDDATQAELAELLRSDGDRGVGATVGQAEDLGALTAGGEFREDRLLEQRFQSCADGVSCWYSVPVGASARMAGALMSFGSPS